MNLTTNETKALLKFIESIDKLRNRQVTIILDNTELFCVNVTVNQLDQEIKTKEDFVGITIVSKGEPESPVIGAINTPSF